MKTRIQLSALAAGIASITCLAAVGCDANRNSQANRDGAVPSESVVAPGGANPQNQSRDQGAVAGIIAGWADRPRLGAQQMIKKYGQPQDVTDAKLVWHNAGPFKKIAVMNLETPHDFPMPHVDYMEHTILYNVPADKLADLLVFDGSSTINRTTGELTARCDLEGHNVLTLNLDHDIVTGKKSVAEARKAFGEMVQQEMMGKPPAYITALQFKPAAEAAAMFSDEPVIPGSPLRAADAKGEQAGDAEILATVVMVDRNEITAASEAQARKLSRPVMDYAKMLNQHHGMSIADTLKVGQQIGTTPVITPKVDDISKKGGKVLATLVPLDGEEFERAYIDAMVTDHTEVLGMLDNQLIKMAKHEAVKAHLTKTRAAVADHLAKAKALQGNR